MRDVLCGAFHEGDIHGLAIDWMAWRFIHPKNEKLISQCGLTISFTFPTRLASTTNVKLASFSRVF